MSEPSILSLGVGVEILWADTRIVGGVCFLVGEGTTLECWLQGDRV